MGGEFNRKILENMQTDEDSYISDSEKIKEKKNGKKRQMNLFGADGKNNDPEKNMMYKRRADIQNLEIKFFKAKEKNDNNVESIKENFSNFKRNL